MLADLLRRAAQPEADEDAPCLRRRVPLASSRSPSDVADLRAELAELDACVTALEARLAELEAPRSWWRRLLTAVP